ncbi:MAG: rRNA adenine N(6)-methyltransferase family protein [Candidatus Saccharimonadaceae bacterium]
MKRLANYSQYFLRNPRMVAELIGHSSIKRSDTVYDIGAGSGVIASALSRRCKEVIAVEVEPRMAEKLRDNMARYDNVTVLEDDFLSMELPAGPYKIFANIPFHLSSPIVRKITESDNSPVAAYLIVQKQFANKLLPDHEGFTGLLGMMIGPWWAVRIRKRLQKTDFWPHPAVDTVMIELVRRDEPLVKFEDRERYVRMVEGCFSDPKIFVKLPIEKIGLTREVKPSQMKLSQWVEVFPYGPTK